MIKISNLKCTLEEDYEELQAKAAAKLGISTDQIDKMVILRESVDARKKSNILFVYQVGVFVQNEKKLVKRGGSGDILLDENSGTAEFHLVPVQSGRKKLKTRPIIIGSGPAGLFAGLIMAKNGYNPIIFERGSEVDVRDQKIDRFFKTGILDEECNIQFGEGGAGTYSDGKLTTRIKDRICDAILEEFVRAGAPDEIRYSFMPHIGTDILRGVVKNIREQIKALGGEFHFDSKLTEVELQNGCLHSIEINHRDRIPCEQVILALGHSARDTYEMLFRKGVLFEQKPFAIGVRIEHPQQMIDESQYGRAASHPRLKGASYKLTYTSPLTGRPCYSFCMCPGGVVVTASSEQNRLVVNGMSEYSRNRSNANSAIVVGVTPGDFGSSHPLAGVDYQRHYEELAYRCGGSRNHAPVQLVGDFMNDELSRKIKGVEPSCTGGYEFGELRNCLPGYVIDTIKDGLNNFDQKIKGFARYDAVMTGIETRTSAPVRMLRGTEFQSLSVPGIYPAGEGAGYAGGIMSAAADGIRVAESLMKNYEAL